MADKPLHGRIALITGASRGLGAALAYEIALQGAHVVLVARTVGALEALDDRIRAEGGSASLVPLDLRQHDLIDALAANLYQRYGKLDLLIGNAAILGDITPVAHLAPTIWQDVMSVNATANYRLIRACDPLLRRGENPQAWFIGAPQAHQPEAYWGAYAASKAALKQMIHCYSQEMAGSQMRVMYHEPPAMRTALRAAAYPAGDTASLSEPQQVAQGLIQSILYVDEPSAASA